MSDRVPATDSGHADRLVALARIEHTDPQMGITLLRRVDDALESAERTAATRLAELAGSGTESPLDHAISIARRLYTALSDGAGRL